MSKNIDLPFGSLPGDTEALLAAFDVAPPELQAKILGDLENTPVDQIPGIVVQLAAQGIMRAQKDIDRGEAIKQAKTLIEQSGTLPAMKGLVAMLIQDGREGSEIESQN